MTRSTLAPLACVVALGCHGHHEHVEPAYFGTKVVPPGVLAKIRPGMTLAEVTAVAPGLRELPLRGYLVDDSHGARQFVEMADGIVASTYVALEGDDATPVITAAWGPPSPDPDHHDTAWRNAETGWLAQLTCGKGTKAMPVPAACTLSFHPYRPAAELFTKAIRPGGVLAALKPDTTTADAIAATHLPFSDHRNFERASDFGGTESVSFHNGRLDSVRYVLPESARPALDKAWGPPAITSDHFVAWLDPSTGWRATADLKGGLYVSFSSYWPLAKLLTTLEAIAASPDDASARREHPELAWDADGKGLTIPDGYRDTVFGTPMHVGLRHQVASVLLHADKPAERERSLAEFAARWGTPKVTTDHDEVTYRYPKHGSVTVDQGMMFVEVR